MMMRRRRREEDGADSVLFKTRTEHRRVGNNICGGGWSSSPIVCFMERPTNRIITPASPLAKPGQPSRPTPFGQPWSG